MAVAAQAIPAMPGFSAAISLMPNGQSAGGGAAIPPMPSEGGTPVAGDSQSPNNAPPPSSIGRDIAGGLASDVQGVADLGNTAIQRVTNPAYQPKITGYRSVGKGMAPVVAPMSPVPQAQVPGLTNFVNQTNPQGLAGNAAYGAGSMLPYALAGGIGDAVKAAGAAPKAWAAMRAMAGLSGAGAASGAGQYIGQNVAPDVGVSPETGAAIGSLAGGVGVPAGGWGLKKLLEAGSELLPVSAAGRARQNALTLKTMVPDYQQVANTIESRLNAGKISTPSGDIPLQPNGAILPGGSAPSVAQLSGSGNAARLEEGLKALGAGSALQAGTDAQRTGAAAAIRQFAPEDGTPGSLGEFLREARANQDAAYAVQEGKDQGAAQSAISQQPGAQGEIGARQAGENLQGALALPDKARQAAVNAVYKQFEERNPTIDLSPLHGTVNDIQNSLEATKAGDVSPAEHDFLSRASELASDPDATWAQMDQLRKEVGTYITDNSGAFGRGTANTVRMQALKNGIDDAEVSAADKVQDAPGWQGVYDKASDEYGKGNGLVRAPRPIRTPLYETVPAEPERLNQYLARGRVENAGQINERRLPGGVQDTGGELGQIFGGKHRVINPNGARQDGAAERAWREGFLPGRDRPDINTLLNAIDKDHNGAGVYRAADQGKVAQRERALQHNRTIGEMADRYGIDPTGLSREGFFHEVARHMHDEEVGEALASGRLQPVGLEDLERAGSGQVSGTAKLSDQTNGAADSGQPGVGGGRNRAQQPSGGRSSIGERGSGVAGASWTKEDSEGIRGARAAHKARMDLYYNDHIGPLLAKIPGGDFKLAGDELLEKAVPGGAKGAAMARAIKATATDNPEIWDHYQTAIGLSLNKAAIKDGVIDRGKLAAWQKRHADLLQELPGLAEKLKNMDAAQAYAEESAVRRADAMSTFKARTISSLLNGDDPGVAMAHLLSGPTEDTKLFAKIVGRDPVAKAAAQKAMADHIANRYLVGRNGPEDMEEAVRMKDLNSLSRNPAQMQNLRTILGDEAPQMIRRIVQEFEHYNTGALSKLSENGSRTETLAETVRRIKAPKTLLGQLIMNAKTPALAGIGVADAAHAGLAKGIATYVGANAAKGFLERARMKSWEALAQALADPQEFLKLARAVPSDPGHAAKFIRSAVSTMLSSAGRLGVSQ